jgi:FixJ family two-component response regulator
VTRKKLLLAIVDDDESVGRAIKRLARSLNMAAESYSSSEDFINQIESLPSFRPDCVILDVQMPGMNGIDVQRRLRLTHQDIPVIFITAYDDDLARKQALAGGATSFLRKPCNDALIIRSLDAALGREPDDKTGEGDDRESE